jgi:hypothetical protein
MRRIALVGLLLISAGCQPFRGHPGAARPGLGVLVNGTAGRCAPVVVGATVRRVCLPPPAAPDTTVSDTTAATR